jgi:hypothetical protein
MYRLSSSSSSFPSSPCPALVAPVARTSGWLCPPGALPRSASRGCIDCDLNTARSNGRELGGHPGAAHASLGMGIRQR